MDGFEGGNASPSKDPPKVAGGTCVESGATAVATAEETSNDLKCAKGNAEYS